MFHSPKPIIYSFGSITYDFAMRPYVMGILNVTPDSFSDGGQHNSPERAFRHAAEMIEEGADFIDVGGESTRPDAEPVALDEELRRTIPVIEALAKEFPKIPISIDTYKYSTAERALDAGATIVNDISGGMFDSEMFPLCARLHATLVIMHIQGTPRTMQLNPQYENVTNEVSAFLLAQSTAAQSAGVQQIIIDPGFGFGKTLEHNLALLKNLKEIESLGYPLLIGVSRKSFIGKILGGVPPQERLIGTAAATALAVANGAFIIRAHDVKATREAAAVAWAIARG